MRPIKFRAWDKKSKTWVSIRYIQWSAENYPQRLCSKKDRQYDFNSVQLMQFTGLKDKHKKEIWEGDIVRNDKTEEIFEVFWDEGMAQFHGIDRKIIVVDGVSFGESFYPLFPLVGKLEVIGNIYLKKELDKREDKD